MHYRLKGVELRTAQALDLGNIGPWLEGQQAVRRIESNTKRLSSDDLPQQPEIWVFPHSPLVKRPD